MSAHRIPAEVFPPGEFVKDELEARGWSQVDLAEVLGRPERVVSEIISAKRAVTPETARGLAAAFGTDPNLWMNLESSYRLSRTEHRDDDVRRRAALFGYAPIKELIRRNWIEATDSIDVLEQRVRDFFGVVSFEVPPAFEGAPRASIGGPNPAQCAWLQRARKMAPMVHAERFVPGRLGSLAASLRPLMSAPEETRRIPKVLSDFGIRMVVVEPIGRTRIDGACFWLADGAPAIALSLRSERIDGFWFTLLHELGHVRSGDGRDAGAAQIDVDLVGEGAEPTDSKSESERAADQFASETLIPDAQMRDFIARVRPLYSKTKIIGFANRIGVHPGIVVGRLQFLKEISYAHNREMLVRVRNAVTQSALTDGWKSMIAVSP
jgi:HTH-type transcriptional regulator / antitoxin HigA